MLEERRISLAIPMQDVAAFDTGGYPAPWIDGVRSEGEFTRTIGEGLVANRFSARELLTDWWRTGFVILPQCIDQELVDRYLSDPETFCARRPAGHSVQIQARKFNRELTPAIDFRAEEMKAGQNSSGCTKFRLRPGN